MAAWFSGWNNTAPGTGQPAPGATQPLGTQPRMLGTQQVTTSAPPVTSGGVSGGPYTVGEVVEYYSTSQGSWILATVLQLNPSGTYNLDCKPDVPREKMRRRAPASGTPGSGPGSQAADFKIGDVVEYHSVSQGTWIPAKVLAVTPKGTYNLDCKPDVPPDKVRRSNSNIAAFPTNNTWDTQRSPLNSGVMDTPGSGNLAPQAPPRGAGVTNSPKVRKNVPSHGSLTSALAGSGGTITTVVPGTGDGGGGNLDIDAPVQLLRVHRVGTSWQYEVCKEGAELLERHGSRRIAVASICGLYRTGKSYLLNMLLERVQRGLPLFKVGATTRACTEGLWLWGSTDSNDEQSPLLAFIDCEGFGSTDSDRTRDAQLMTLCTLLSSVLVLNTKGALNESMFNALALTCRFAEHIEERGHEASRPVLLWVLRDFMLELRDGEGRPISPDEYLEKALLAAPVSSTDKERSAGAREVRQSLLKFFGHRSCVTLVQPAVEETQLQRLETLPFASLRGEFRAGVEALRTQLVATCHSNPKTMGGQPLGCYSFVALTRQLVAALNQNRVLSMKGAWETVQHTACGALADEIRASAREKLRSLAGGEKLTGGAQLPLTSEALHTVLRDLRHSLKSQWGERAVGDEAVRKEYWQELKETLAIEESSVRQQNARLADEQLNKVLDRWQEWLDDEAKADAVGEQISRELGQLMEKMPAAQLSRAGRAAIEAAARRVSAARTALLAAVDQSAETQRKARQWGEQASQQAGMARTEAEARQAEIKETQELIKRTQHAEQTRLLELEAQKEELESAKKELQVAVEDADNARSRCRDMSAQIKAQDEKEASVRSELEQVRQESSKADAELQASEACAQAAHDVAAAEKKRLEAAFKQAQAEVTETAERLTAEREALRGENTRTKEEHNKLVEEVRRQTEIERTTLQGEHEKTRDEHSKMVEDARRQLEKERVENQGKLESGKARLMEIERNSGVLEGRVQAFSTEATMLRDRIAELQETIREAEGRTAQQESKGERLQQELERARADIQRGKADGAEAIKAKEEENARLYAHRFPPRGPEDEQQPKCCTVQ
eukprot:TRINITY_DN49772_c0_g1_i1.p1 TRINITY_DN49772_c0_g1~~TRINITY_DN49772_c0_g1_i1.p1  ORF type:complete len:1095 (+),score=250.15 TRINITY_DN49772_c0_g1_i1:74-3286(+)